MESRDLYARLTGVGRLWTVTEVAHEEARDRVNVSLACSETAEFPCPCCHKYLPVVGYSSLMTWRHLDTCHMETYLHARLPIVQCSEHGKQEVPPPWGEPGVSVTRDFEEWVGRLREGFGDSGKALRFLRLEPIQIRDVERRRARDARSRQSHAGTRSTPDESARPRVRQPSLFEQNDMSLANRGIQAFRRLELEEAVELFRKHRDLYPKGYNIDSRLSAAECMQHGMRGAPSDPRELPGYLCGFWKSFESRVISEIAGGETLITELEKAFFSKVDEAITACLAEEAVLPADIPYGYVLLQSGKYEEAIRELQAGIAQSPDNAALYGYLGDAYWQRGNSRVARQCYREGFAIDPAAIDWHRLRDKDLHELKEELLFIYGGDHDLAVAWLPSHSRINGLFERKEVRVHRGLKEIVDEYLSLEKSLSSKKTPILEARLFFKGMILCENQESLKFIKKIDTVQIRREMKQANALLFEEFLEMMARGANPQKGIRV
ncbi:MAG: tetratricopeptide repeat protein [Syntrophobacter sp.]